MSEIPQGLDFPLCLYPCLRRLSFLVLSAIVTANCQVEAIEIGQPFSVSQTYRPGDRFMQIRLLGLIKLRPQAGYDYQPQELSGIAWDSDEEILYAISDNGVLLHLRPRFSGEFLSGTELLAVFPLKDPNGHLYTPHTGDAEGLVAMAANNGQRGDTQLAVSFERQPRITLFDTRGNFLSDQALPPALSDISHYQGANKALEALTHHPQYGFIVAPERPLRGARAPKYTFHALNGRVWRYAGIDPPRSDIVGLETLPSGELLLLERRYISIFRPLIFTLRLINLPTDSNTIELVREIVRFDTSRGWAIDNFEGVAHHKENRYFIVSDDNKSVFQNTLLMYFEILPPKSKPLNAE